MNNALSQRTQASKIVVEEIRISEFQKEDTATAVLRQIVTTFSKYQGKRQNNSFTDAIFANEEFGEEFLEKEYESVENRVAFVNVPLNATVEQVQKAIDAIPRARIYRILDNHPILSDAQLYSIRIGQRTKDQYALKQVARYGKDTKDKMGNDISGQLVKDSNSKLQYRGTYFSKTGKADIDKRTVDPEDQYIPAELVNELTDTVVEETLDLSITSAVESTGQQA